MASRYVILKAGETSGEVAKQVLEQTGFHAEPAAPEDQPGIHVEYSSAVEQSKADALINEVLVRRARERSS